MMFSHPIGKSAVRAIAFAALAVTSYGANYIKQNNTTALNLAGAWSAGGPPTGADTATWDVTCGNNRNAAIGGSVTWAGIIVSNDMTGDISINNSAGAILTLNGIGDAGNTSIDMTSANRNLTIQNNVALASNQTWNVISGRKFEIGSYTLSGTGIGFTKEGSGNLSLRTSTLAYTGKTTINGGVIMVFGNKGTGNWELNNGMVTDYYRQTTSWSGLGTGAGQIQIYGASGFGAGNGGSGWRIAGGATLVWGSTYFNPTQLKFLTGMDNMGPSIYGLANLNNGIDLNGGEREIWVRPATGANFLNSYGRVNGVISDGLGGGGIVKVGGGQLLLGHANTFSGPVTIREGTLAVTTIANVASPNPLGQSSAAAGNLVIEDGARFRYTGGAASCDRAFTIGGTNDAASAILYANGSGALTLSSSSSPAYGTPNQTRTLILDGPSTHANTLAANIANNGSGLVSVLKRNTGTWVLSGDSDYAGETIVTNGILRLSHRHALPSATSLYLYSGSTTGTIDLAFIGVQKITALYINDVKQPNGIYGANGITITGTGFLSPGSLGTVLTIK